MEFSSDYVYCIRDKISGRFLNNIWLSSNNIKSIFSDAESAQKMIERIKFGKYISKGYLGYKAKDLEIVKFELKISE